MMISPRAISSSSSATFYPFHTAPEPLEPIDDTFYDLQDDCACSECEQAGGMADHVIPEGHTYEYRYASGVADARPSQSQAIHGRLWYRSQQHQSNQGSVAVSSAHNSAAPLQYKINSANRGPHYQPLAQYTSSSTKPPTASSRYPMQPSSRLPQPPSRNVYDMSNATHVSSSPHFPYELPSLAPESFQDDSPFTPLYDASSNFSSSMSSSQQFCDNGPAFMPMDNASSQLQYWEPAKQISIDSAFTQLYPDTVIDTPAELEWDSSLGQSGLDSSYDNASFVVQVEQNPCYEPDHEWSYAPVQKNQPQNPQYTQIIDAFANAAPLPASTWVDSPQSQTHSPFTSSPSFAQHSSLPQPPQEFSYSYPTPAISGTDRVHGGSFTRPRPATTESSNLIQQQAQQRAQGPPGYSRRFSMPGPSNGYESETGMMTTRYVASGSAPVLQQRVQHHQQPQMRHMHQPHQQPQQQRQQTQQMQMQQQQQPQQRPMQTMHDSRNMWFSSHDHEPPESIPLPPLPLPPPHSSGIAPISSSPNPISANASLLEIRNPMTPISPTARLKRPRDKTGLVSPKAKKLRKACEFCRFRKVACIREQGGNGPCTRCSKKRRECVYPVE